MKRASSHLSITFTLILALGLAFGLLWLLDGPAGVAHADLVIRYVATTGTDTGTCINPASPCRTVQYAIDVASAPDEIWVAGGTYTDTAGTVADIDESVKLLGGWDRNFTLRDPASNVTTLDARGLGRVVEIVCDCSAGIDGFTITGGNAADEAYQEDEGGGILSVSASPIIQNNVVVDNMASITPTSGYGGGIALYSAPATAVISGNVIVSNTGTSGSSGFGGGLYVWNSASTISGNEVLSNTASFAGGGIMVLQGSPMLVDNDIKFNVSGRSAGGIHLGQCSALVEGNLILGNKAGWDGTNWHGGAILVEYGRPTITANRIYSNSSQTAAVGMETSDYFTITNNLIAHNDHGGIRLWELTRYALVANNTVVSNLGYDGGIYLWATGIIPTVVNNIIVSNSCGIRAHAGASGLLDYNDVWDNDTDYDLPGVLDPGAHDIQADPLFADASALDFHIAANSPAVNAGTFSGAPPIDYYGDARPYDCFVDIGADENAASDECRWVSLPLVVKKD